MIETLHWYAETSGGVQTGNCTVTENGGALHLTADLPAGTLKTVRAELPWTMEADERLFMNGYQTWTYSPELDRNGKLRGTDHIPGFLLKKYAFDRYGDYHLCPTAIITARATAFPTAISARAGSSSWWHRWTRHRATPSSATTAAKPC